MKEGERNRCAEKGVWERGDLKGVRTMPASLEEMPDLGYFTERMPILAAWSQMPGAPNKCKCSCW